MDGGGGVVFKRLRNVETKGKTIRKERYVWCIENKFQAGQYKMRNSG